MQSGSATPHDPARNPSRRAPGLSRKLLALAIGVVLAALVAWAAYGIWFRPAPLPPANRSQIEDFLAARIGGERSETERALALELRPGDPDRFMSENDANLLYQGPARNQQYDVWAYFAHKPLQREKAKWSEHQDGYFTYFTNSLGLREDAELPEHPDVRVLVAGDSHVDGYCNQSETYPNLLEVALGKRAGGRTVDVVNASDGGYSFHNYLGVLLKFAGLGARVFVLNVHGGNDFDEVLLPDRYFARDPMPPENVVQREQRLTARAKGPGAMFQGLASVAWFRNNPGDVDRALRVSLELVQRMKRECDERGMAMIVVYLPSPIEIERERLSGKIEPARSALALTDEDLEKHAAIGRRFLERVAAAGIETFDTGPVLRAAGGPVFWAADLHLSVAGHVVIARALEERIASLCGIAPAPGKQ